MWGRNVTSSLYPARVAWPYKAGWDMTSWYQQEKPRDWWRWETWPFKDKLDWDCLSRFALRSDEYTSLVRQFGYKPVRKGRVHSHHKHHSGLEWLMITAIDSPLFTFYLHTNDSSRVWKSWTSVGYNLNVHWRNWAVLCSFVLHPASVATIIRLLLELAVVGGGGGVTAVTPTVWESPSRGNIPAIVIRI